MLSPQIRDQLFDCEDEPFTRDQVSKLENTLGVQFPDDYVEFLLQFNRPGCNNPLSFDVPDHDDPEQEIESFFGRQPEEDFEFDDYLDATDAFGEDVPETHVAIASCIGLGYVALRYVRRNAKFDGVWFWDREAHPRRGEQVVYRVADTFTDFLNSLQVDFDEPEQTEPLFQAVERGELARIKKYLAEGGDPNHRNADGVPLLIVAAQSRWPKIVALLLQNSADPNIRDRTGMTALHIAAMSCVDNVKLLLAAGADVKAKDKKGRPIRGFDRADKLIVAHRAKK